MCSNKYKIVYVDGACSLKNNSAGVGVYSDDLNFNESVCIDSLFDKKTNSLAELYAIKHALDMIDNTNCCDNKICIKSDSIYAVKSLSIWIHTWIKDDWMTSTKKKVCHKELIEQIYNRIANKDISIQWISRIDNDKADKLAKASVIY